MAPRTGRDEVPLRYKSLVFKFVASRGGSDLKTTQLCAHLVALCSQTLWKWTREATFERNKAEFTTQRLDELYPHAYSEHNTECLSEAIWIVVVKYIGERYEKVEVRVSHAGVTYELRKLGDGYRDALRHAPSWFAVIDREGRPSAPYACDFSGVNMPAANFEEACWTYAYVMRLEPVMAHIVRSRRRNLVSRLTGLFQQRTGDAFTDERLVLMWNLFALADMVGRGIPALDEKLFEKALTWYCAWNCKDLDDESLAALEAKFAAIDPLFAELFRKKLQQNHEQKE